MVISVCSELKRQDGAQAVGFRFHSREREKSIIRLNFHGYGIVQSPVTR